ncbi:short transient receptor potential channel 4-like [Glandiceps talaboti]
MLATLRLMENLLPSKYLGPMLLCFLAMRKDVIRFLCIFSIITFAFSAGLYYLYADPHNTTQNAYSSLLFSINSLLFTIFGRDASADLLATVMVPLYNESRAQQHIATLNMSGDDWTHRPTFDASQIYTAMGMVLYTTFGIGVLLVLLNICIAMMSDRYARFQESVDEEWKFVRTVMWVHCFSTPTLPSPFNLIPSPMYLYNLVQCMCGWRRACNKMKTNEVGIVLQDVPVSLPYQEDAWDLTYDELVRVLVHRYLQKKVPKTKNGSPRQTKDVDTSSATPHQQNELRLLNSTPV